MNIIELKGITKTYGNHKAVDDLSLNVPKGSIYGFIGPNGSGKTTTIRMIMNILYPDSGNIMLSGKESIGAKMENVGYLPEERGLYSKMKVRDIVKFYGELKGVKDLNSVADMWLKKFDLTKWADKKVEALSKGMSQKVQFIITVIDHPKLIILDEPFSGLDPVNAEIIKEEILKLRDKGSTIIFSTHDMSVAEKMCDYIFMIYKGKKVLDGTLTSIQEKFGQDTLRVQTESGAARFNEIKGIEKVNDFGQVQELRMEQGADSQEVLRAIMDRTRIHKFELTSPSLNDIFIRIARPENTEDHE